MSSLRRTSGAEIDKPRQKRQRTRLVEHVVQVAAFWALDTRRAARGAGAAAQHRCGIANPAFELVEAALGDADPARMAVVDEDRRPSGLGVVIRRQTADVPPV